MEYSKKINPQGNCGSHKERLVTTLYTNLQKKSTDNQKKSITDNPQGILCVNRLDAPARAAGDCPQDPNGRFAYLDTVGNLDLQGGSHKSCGRYALSGECSNGHRIAMVIRCWREWCSRCGQKKSDAHKRRYGRIIDKAQRMRSMGVFTITFPPEEREKLRSKKAISGFTRSATAVVKSYLYRRGITRWHWFGEPVCGCGHLPKKGFAEWYDEEGRRAGIVCPKCGKKDFHELKNTWNPHLNIVVDAGKLSKDKLASIKDALRGLGPAPNVIHYSYTNKPGKMLHRLRYITRATFRALSWDPVMAAELKGYRNLRYWGTKTVHHPGYWDTPIVWKLENLSKKDKIDLEDAEEMTIVKNICICGGEITWSNVIIDCMEIPAERVKPLDKSGRYYMIL